MEQPWLRRVVLTLVLLILNGCAGWPENRVHLAPSTWWLTDNTPPAITLNVPPGPVQGAIPVTLAVRDDNPLAGASVTLDGRPLTPFAGPEAAPPEPIALDTTFLINTATLPDGEHLIRVEASDSSRQVNQAVVTATFRSDNTPPALTVTLDPPQPTQGHTLVIAITSNEPATVTAKLAGLPLVLHTTATATGFWGITAFAVDATPGPRLLNLTAVDRVGNTTHLTATVPVTQFPFRVETGGGVDVIILPPERMALLNFAEAEIKDLDQVWARVSPLPLWNTPFTVPLQSRYRVTTAFGTARSYGGGPPTGHHMGTDLAVEHGTPVYASARGRVVLAGPLKVRGNAVILDHGLGLFSAYYHLSEIAVSEGEMIAAGQRIGKVGDTGLSTGPHLHWEMRLAGVAIDPWEWTRRPIVPP